MSGNSSLRLAFCLGLVVGLLALCTRAPAQSGAAAPTPTPDRTIHILSDVQGLDVGAYGKMVFTRDNDGDWSFANVGLPTGTTIDDWTSINSHGVIAGIGNGGHALLLMPITYAELSPASGFDGLTQLHWLMVPQYGSNFAQATTPASATLSIGFTIKPDSPVDSVSPATTTQSPQTITVHGETVGDTYQVALGVGTKVATGGGLNVSIKPMKTVTVALHAITLEKGDTYGPTPNAPTAQQAQDYLNQVYGPQTNTYFVVTRKDYDLDYDIGGSSASVNGKLDFTPIQPYTAEQMVIENSYAKDYSVNFNIYFVHDYSDRYGQDSIGHAIVFLKSAYIRDYSGHTAIATVLGPVHSRLYRL